MLIEECIFPFLKQLSFFHLTTLGSIPDYLELESVSLGKTVNILSQNNTFYPATHPAPLKLPLNQVRNISFHCNYKIRENSEDIFCTYGKNRNKSIVINYSDLTLLFIELLTIYDILKSANSFYTIDYSNCIQDIMSNPTVSNDTCIATISEILTANGLKIKDIDHKENDWHILAIDPIARDQYEHRMILLQALRFITLCSNTTVTFTIRLLDGTLSIAETSDSLFFQIDNLSP